MPRSVPTARTLPSGLKATEKAGLMSSSLPLGLNRWSVAVRLPVCMSQSRTVPSMLAEARVLPSGLKAMDQTSWGPLRVARSRPVATSHTFTSPAPGRPVVDNFPPPAAKSFPSGLKAAYLLAPLTDPGRPLREAFSFPVDGSHRIAVSLSWFAKAMALHDQGV